MGERPVRRAGLMSYSPSVSTSHSACLWSRSYEFQCLDEEDCSSVDAEEWTGWSVGSQASCHEIRVGSKGNTDRIRNESIRNRDIGCKVGQVGLV